MTAPLPFEVVVAPDGDTTVVRVRGELDLATAREMVLRSPTRPVRRALEIAGLDSVFPIEAALADGPDASLATSPRP